MPVLLADGIIVERVKAPSPLVGEQEVLTPAILESAFDWHPRREGQGCERMSGEAGHCSIQSRLAGPARRSSPVREAGLARQDALPVESILVTLMRQSNSPPRRLSETETK